MLTLVILQKNSKTKPKQKIRFLQNGEWPGRTFMEKVKSILTVYRNDEIFSKQIVFRFCFSALKQIQTHLRNSQGQEKYFFYIFVFKLIFSLNQKKRNENADYRYFSAN